MLKLPRWFPLGTLIAALLGLLQSAAFMHDAAWPIEIAALAGIAALVVRAAGFWSGVRLGFSFALAWLVTGIWWLYVSLHDYGALPPLLAAGGTFLLCVYLSVYSALACGVMAVLSQRASIATALMAFPALWALSEVLRGYVFTGFPWIASGYAHVGGPLVGFAPLWGVYGVGFCAAAVAAALVALAGGHLMRPRLRTVALALLVGVPTVGAVLTKITWAAPLGAPLHVKLLQGNIAQEIKFDPDHFKDTVDAYLPLIESGPADLIVLPETAFPATIQDLPPTLLERLEHDAKTSSAMLAFGIPIIDPGDRFSNSVVAIPAAGGDWLRYNKSHLVPFGEFVPVGFHWFVAMLKIPLGDQTSGLPSQPPFALHEQRLGFDICYEDLFGAAIARQARTATVLVNTSNLAWFGNTRALDEHLQIARMRAIETSRPMLRSTNTGITAAISPKGLVIGQLPPFTRAALEATVQGTTGNTPYTLLGDVPVVLLSGIVLVAAMLAARKKKS